MSRNGDSLAHAVTCRDLPPVLLPAASVAHSEEGKELACLFGRRQPAVDDPARDQLSNREVVQPPDLRFELCQITLASLGLAVARLQTEPGRRGDAQCPLELNCGLGSDRGLSRGYFADCLEGSRHPPSKLGLCHIALLE